MLGGENFRNLYINTCSMFSFLERRRVGSEDYWKHLHRLSYENWLVLGESSQTEYNERLRGTVHSLIAGVDKRAARERKVFDTIPFYRIAAYPWIPREAWIWLFFLSLCGGQKGRWKNFKLFRPCRLTYNARDHRLFSKQPSGTICTPPYNAWRARELKQLLTDNWMWFIPAFDTPVRAGERAEMRNFFFNFAPKTWLRSPPSILL